MKRAVFLLALSALAAVLAANVSAAAPKSGALMITHVVRGCHTWSLNGAPSKVDQVVTLAHGGSLVVTNNDLMVQDLVKTSGPAVVMKLVAQSHMGKTHMTMPMNGKATQYATSHMGAQVKVTFPTVGTYHLKLVDRGDYFEGIKTVGPDNEPTLSVSVS